MLSDKAKQELIKRSGCPGDVEFQINRKSKWVVEISLVKGLALYAKYKFNCRNHSMQRAI